MSSERTKLIHSLIFPVLITLLIWVVKLVEVTWKLDFAEYGIYPLTLKGLRGILLAPLIHENFAHLLANTVPLFVLSAAIFYFYRDIAWKVVAQVYLLTGLWVWLLARESYHIGASGLIYGFAAFLFFSGVMRREGRSMALSLLVVFLYGGMLWGIFPKFFPDRNISWESHLMGLVAGMIIAVYYRNTGMQRKKYDWEIEEEYEAETGMEEWQTGEEPGKTDSPEKKEDPPEVRYHYRS